LLQLPPSRLTSERPPRPLPASSSVARLVLALALAAVTGGAARPALAQFFSPGLLARPHAALEGLESCSKCHDEKHGHSPALCLSCHTELQPGIARGTGLHGRLSTETRNQCQRCHPDHRGLDFAMVDWGTERRKFDHQRAGWALQGKHARQPCESCHAAAKVVLPDIARMLAAQPKRPTFLGLSTRCTSCHFDEHRGELGAECGKCHQESSWRPASLFNHQTTSYPLRGQHRTVACAKCHPTLEDEELDTRSFPPPRAQTYMQMRAIDHRTCASCHDDPHQGKLGSRCADCHSEASWKQVSPLGGADRSFHARSRFPLQGAHISVPCASCHGPFPGAPARYKGLAFGKCSSCHEDAHAGQLAGGPGKAAPDCARCHDTDTFFPPRFELEQHAESQFPLDGAHRAAACRGCHAQDARLAAAVPAHVRNKLRLEHRPLLTSLAKLKPGVSPNSCSTCHQDVHAGQFAREVGEEDCAACHRTSSFTDLRFDHDRDARFPLTGAHRSTACASCHPREPTPATPGTAVRYKPLPLTCGGCHADQHQGQFTWTKAAGATEPQKTGRDCSSCHATSRFKETLFSHDDRQFTTFALRGKHAALACGACHRNVAVSPGVLTVRYRPLPRRCDECHQDFHGGDFRGFEPPP
jgi:hypothetical protein